MTEIVFNENKLQIPFVVVRGRHECLLSYQTAQLLGIIKLSVNQINAKPMTKQNIDELTQRFPKLFSGKLGCMKDFEVKLDVDETVKPVRQAQRPVAFHLRPLLERELRKQVNDGILEFVDETCLGFKIK